MDGQLACGDQPRSPHGGLLLPPHRRPIARHAKAHGYEALLPYLCRTDHFLAEVMHARLIRTQTEALGGNCCDYWYVGDKSPVLDRYAGLKQI